MIEFFPENFIYTKPIMNATNGFILQTMLFMVNYNQTNLLDSIYNEEILQPQDSSEVRCFGVYGCFGVDGRRMTCRCDLASMFCAILIQSSQHNFLFSHNFFHLRSVEGKQSSASAVSWKRLLFADNSTFF